MNLRMMAEAELELRKRRADRLKDYETQRDFYSAHPIEYISDRLGVRKDMIDWELLEAYKSHQWDGTRNPLKTILEALAEGKWVGVESATSTGKTFLGACIVLWFLECFKNAMVVTSAPKQDQLSLFIWKEITKLFPVFGRGDLTTLRLRMVQDSDEWVAIGFVAGIKANEDSATKAQGFHAEHMLIILEETPGIPQPIITAFQNTCTAPHNIMLAFGNPDHQLDNLHRFCKLPNVTHVRISAFDHPNVVLDDANFIPGAASRLGLRRIKERYGDEMNPLYRSRARGISPAQGQASLIKLEWCYASTPFDSAQGPEDRDHRLYALGVDVANSEGGDKAAIAFGYGDRLLKIDDFQCPDANQLGKRDIYTLIYEYTISPRRVGVDGVGVGAGTINALKELGIQVMNLGGGEQPIDLGFEEQFNNLRSQMYWQLREDLRNGIIQLPNDEELFADLITPKWFTRNGKIVVESKEEIKKRLGHSPNKGDAVVYWNWVRHLGGEELVVSTRRSGSARKILEGY